MYDVERRIPVAQFGRMVHSELDGILTGYKVHPIRSQLIELIMVDKGTYTIFEIDIFHNE